MTCLFGPAPLDFYNPAKWVERGSFGAKQLEFGADYVKAYAKLPIDETYGLSAYSVSYVDSTPRTWVSNRRLKFRMQSHLYGTSDYMLAAVGIGGGYPDLAGEGIGGSFAGFVQMQIDDPENHHDWAGIVGVNGVLSHTGTWGGWFGSNGDLELDNTFEIRWFYNDGNPYAEFYQKIDDEMELRQTIGPDLDSPLPSDDEPLPDRKQDLLSITVHALDADCWCKISEIEYEEPYEE